MANNKIQLSDGTVLIDLTSDTVTAADVAQGKTFHLANGTPATGTASGGGNPNENLAKWADGTLTTLDLTGAQYISARFRSIGMGNEFTVYAPDATEIQQYAFHQTSKLVGFDGKKVTTLGGQCFYNTRIPLIVLPSFNTSGQTNTFNQSSALVVADLGEPKSLGGSFFANCTSLSTLIIRKSGAITTLSNINVFTNTPFASDGSGGTLYVPQALLSTYQSASNWSTILGYSTNSIAAIEGSQYENYYADGTPV